MKDTDKTKKEFEKSLFKLLSKKNYHDITINEICLLASKTKMTFYPYYFPRLHCKWIPKLNQSFSVF